MIRCSSVAVVLALLASASRSHPVFDGESHSLLVLCLTALLPGKVRKTSDGRYEAYLVPPAAANHASFLELLPGGELVLAWFSGTAEGADNCSIVVARLPSGGDQWSNASLVSRRPGYSNQNPVLFLDSSGKVRNTPTQSPLSPSLQVLYLFHSQQPAAPGEPRSAEAWANIWELESSDGGISWTTPRDVFTKNGSFDRNRIVYSLRGDWLFPIYYSGL